MATKDKDKEPKKCPECGTEGKEISGNAYVCPKDGRKF